MGIEPTIEAWEAAVLPLHHGCAQKERGRLFLSAIFSLLYLSFSLLQGPFLVIFKNNRAVGHFPPLEIKMEQDIMKV